MSDDAVAIIDRLSNLYLPYSAICSDNSAHGTDTSDATITPETVLKPYVGYGADGRVVGAYEPPVAAGALSVAKVTEYTPYSAAYKAVVGVTVSGLTGNGEEDYSVFNGTYNLTPETAGETDWKKRVYKHESSDRTIKYYLDEYEAEYSYWCINDTNGYTIFAYYTSGDLPNDTNQWENFDGGEMYNIGTAPVTKEVPEQPLVLRGVRAVSYDTARYVWTWETEAINLAGFEVEPELRQMFALDGSTKLVGKPLGYDPGDLLENAFFYCSNSKTPLTVAETGQPLVCVESWHYEAYTPRVAIKKGVPCLYADYDEVGGHTMYISAPFEGFRYYLCSDCTAVATVYYEGGFSDSDGCRIFSNPLCVSEDKFSPDRNFLNLWAWGFAEGVLRPDSVKIAHGDRDDMHTASLPGNALQAGKWYQLVTLYRNGKIELWVNGEKTQDSDMNSHHTRTDLLHTLYMCTHPSRVNRITTTEYLSDCYVFQHALSEAEIKTLWRNFNTQQLPEYTGLPKEYVFRASFMTGVVAETGHNLIITGAPTITMKEDVPCAYFDGAAGIAFELSVPGSGLMPPAHQWWGNTISAWVWVNPDDYGNDLSRVIGNLFAGKYVGTSPTGYDSLKFPTGGGWMHVAVVNYISFNPGMSVEGDQVEIPPAHSKVFVNGAYLFNSSHVSEVNSVNGIATADDSGNRFRGCVAEAIVYDRVLEEADIKMLAAQYVNGWKVAYEGTPEDGLVFRAKFDGSAATETGQAITAEGTPTYETVEGVPCVRFNGTNYMTYPDAGFPSGTSPRTVAFWCYVDSLSQYSNPLIFGYGTRSSQQFCGVFVESGGRINFSGQASNITSDSNISVGRWHHVACTKGADGVEKIYIDGKEAGTGTSAKNTVLGLGQIADTTDSDTYRYAGCLAEAVVYNRELSIVEIKQLAAQFAE